MKYRPDTYIPILRCLRGLPPAKRFRFSKPPGGRQAEINDNKQGVKEMSDQTKSTQQATQSAANQVTSNSSSATIPNSAAVANSPGHQTPSNTQIQLPPALSNAGSKK
jgi:hypothetical protein